MTKVRSPLLPLSERESEVFQLLMQGKTNKEIAQSLNICLKTVEEHLTSIYQKIGTTSRAKTILWGIRRGGEFSGY